MHMIRACTFESQTDLRRNNIATIGDGMSRGICFLKLRNPLFFGQVRVDADENAEQTIISVTLSNTGHFGGLKHCEAPWGKTVSMILRLSTLSVQLQ